MSSKNLFGNLTGTQNTTPLTDEEEQKLIDAQKDEITPSSEDVQEEPEEVDDTSGSVEDEEDDLPMPSELEMLKDRAKLMGIKHSNNISVEALKARIQAKLDGEKDPEPEVKNNEPAAEEQPKVKASKPTSLRKALYDENMRLVRIRITNMDPKEASLPGGIFTIANEYLGTVSKYVPFGEQSENGYHVPYCILKFLKSQKFLQIRVTKKNGKENIETGWVRKFAIEELPPLSDKELNVLKASQLAAGAID